MENNITVTVPGDATELASYYELRWRLLRKPHDQARGSEIDEQEDNGFHVAAYTKERETIGVGRLHFNSPHQAQIRFMAVLPEYQNQGIGSMILSQLECQARNHQARFIVLHARTTAAGFYEQFGYTIVGTSHTLYGTIPHVLMQKNLAEAP